MARKHANMSDLLKENQKFEELPAATEQGAGEQQDINTTISQNSDTTQHQESFTSSSESTNEIAPQSNKEETPQSDKTAKHKNPTSENKPKNTNTVKQQKGSTTKAQSSKKVLSQPINTTIPQSDNTSDKKDRDRVTFYLNPGQREKLEDLRIEYRKTTGERINEQELIRRVIDRLTLDSLL
jgi:hypothetical protein